jgi:hypothetical protein
MAGTAAQRTTAPTRRGRSERILIKKLPDRNMNEVPEARRHGISTAWIPS